MQGRKQYQEGSVVTVNVAVMVPKSHLLLRVDKALEQGMSLIRMMTEEER